MVRLGMGLLCLFGVREAVLYMPELVARSALPAGLATFALLLLFGLWVFAPVVNIGWGLSLGGMPRLYALGAFAFAALAGAALYGTPWSPVLGWAVWTFLVYTFGHLGASFLLSALIATPGCEMRALPHLYSLATGRATAEHYCPGMLDKVDAWEGGSRPDPRAPD